MSDKYDTGFCGIHRPNWWGIDKILPIKKCKNPACINGIVDVYKDVNGDKIEIKCDHCNKK